MQIPTRDEIRYIVCQVVADPSEGPLDEALTRAIWMGEEPPNEWGGWPEEAVQAWSYGCELFTEMHRNPRVLPPPKQRRLTLGLSWSLVHALTTGPPGKWWVFSGVTWADFGRKMGTTARKAAYRMGTLGWRFTGSGMHVPSREVVEAPCKDCGTIWTPPEIHERLGPCCGPRPNGDRQ